MEPAYAGGRQAKSRDKMLTEEHRKNAERTEAIEKAWSQLDNQGIPQVGITSF